MTKRQTQVMKAIKAGNFALCHLYEIFRISYASLTKHVQALADMGYVFVDGAGSEMRFSPTARGSQVV